MIRVCAFPLVSDRNDFGCLEETSHRRGNREREGEDRGIKGILGEFEACLARFKLQTAGIVGAFAFLIKFQSHLPRICPDVLPKFRRPISFQKFLLFRGHQSSQLLLPRRCEVCSKPSTSLPFPPITPRFQPSRPLLPRRCEVSHRGCGQDFFSNERVCEV